MITKESLSRRIVDYFKKAREGDFEVYYVSEEEAYENFLELLSKKPVGVCMEMAEEVSMMLNEFDLTDPKVNDLYKECTSIAYDLNHYKVQFEKDKQQESIKNNLIIINWDNCYGICHSCSYSYVIRFFWC